MLSIFLVFSLILGTIALISFQKVTADADSTLSILAANDGLFPKPEDEEAPPSLDAHPGGGHKMSPELPYESRFFSVLFDSDGNLISVNTARIAAVDTDEAIVFGQEVLASGSTKGYQHAYRYVVTQSAEGIRVIFLDCGRSLSNLRFFVGIGLLVFFLGLLAVWLLTIVLSRYIVRPIAQSYEKQKRFITDGGHEIKTPLTIIDADAEVLAMDLGENEWINDIQEQSRRLAALTNDLILLSRLEEDNTQMQLLDFPISDVAEEVAHSFQALAITQKKEFSISIQPMLTLCGDEKMIRQLLMILLDNALKYVYGPERSGNGALDYNGEASITGGLVIAFGPSGMAQNFGASSTQGAMLVSISGSAGDTVTLTASDGTVLVSCQSQKAYSSVVISCPELVQGETYTLNAGGTSTQITMDSLIYGETGGFGGGWGGMMPDGTAPNGTPPDGTAPNTAPDAMRGGQRQPA